MKVFISSAGRRNYLVEWFKSAAALIGIEIRVICGDGDPHAPALSAADNGVVLPEVLASDHIDRLVTACTECQIDLLFSVHDYEIAAISARALEHLCQQGVAVAVPPESTMSVVADKYATAEALWAGGLLAPRTILAADPGAASWTGRSVVKHRFGSGSSGLFIVDVTDLSPAVLVSSLSAPTEHGSKQEHPDATLVIIQELVDGEEFGLDVVCDLEGKYHGVLARRKLRMRAGETDRAVTVDAAPFEPLARKLAEALELRGNTDVDVIVTPDGEQYIIDINPRFGGGYPFMHMAGANVPACYLAWAMGREIDPAWLQYEVGVVSSKYEAIQRAGV